MKLFLLIVNLIALLLKNCECVIEDPASPLIFTVASASTDGYKRFIHSAEYYGLKVNTLGMDEPWKGGDMNFRGGGYKVNLLRKALAPYADKNEERIVLFTDSYDVIFLSDWEVILEKFKESKSKILFGAENFCWPDESLKSKYPSAEGNGQRFLNSGMFIGYLKNIWNLLNYEPIEDTDDDQLYYTTAYLNEKFREDNSFKLDHKSNLFQNLNGNIADVSVAIDNEGKSKLLNKNYVKHPSVVHGNGPSKLVLNNFGNYLAGAFIDGECTTCEENTVAEELIDSFTVEIAVFIETPTPFLEEFLDKILHINYPKNKIHLFVHNAIEYHYETVDLFLQYAKKEDYLSIKFLNHEVSTKEAEARELAVERCMKKECDYLFVVDADAHLDNMDVLRDLIYYNKDVLSPKMRRVESVWANFWGAISDKGFYARSSDYLSIVKNEVKGIWNVPYITSCYLIKSKVLSNLKYKHSELDPDMALAFNLRNQGIFMYTVNLFSFGHLVSTDNFDIKKTKPEFYELLENKFDWEKRFIREEYYAQLLPETVPKQPCPDVYWFPIGTDIFCDSMVAIMENFGKWSDGSSTDKRLQGGYEAVPTRDIHMNQVGLEAIWLKFLQIYVKPLQEKVFLGYFHDPPRSLMNFVVRYKPDEQPNLRPHHDSSTYTINIALNRKGIDYEGGGCRFLRYNCSVEDTEKGYMLMHPGRLTHFHEGLTVTKGTRYIMISFVDP